MAKRFLVSDIYDRDFRLNGIDFTLKANVKKEIGEAEAKLLGKKFTYLTIEEIKPGAKKVFGVALGAKKG